MVDAQQVFDLGMQILSIELENELRRSAATAISSYKPKFGIHRTGHLVRNIRVSMHGNTLNITMPDYGAYVEFGTGIFGPHATPIVPTTKKALAFGKYVFKSVAGRPATPFLRPVFHAKLQKLAEDAFKKAITHLQQQNG